MSLPAEVALFIGILIGAFVTFLWRYSERSQAQAEPIEPPIVSADVSAVLGTLRASAVLLDPGNQVVEASAPAYELGLIGENRLRNTELEQMVSAVRRDQLVREESFTIDRRRKAPAFVVARVAPLASGLILVLVEDRTREHQVETLRRDFVANASHELKTPIGAIKLLAEAIGEASEDPAAVENFASRLTIESDRLTQLIQQIIELSRVQDDELAGDSAVVPMSAVAAEAIEVSQTAADAKSISIMLEADPTAQLFGNRVQLLSAISNLVENAVTYSPEGSAITVSVTSANDEVSVTVADNGIGIKPTDHERVFERFYRVDPARARSTGGTGLGLSIVKHVAARHGGRVDVWSEPKVGSSFTITLPAYESEEGAHGDPSPAR